MLSSGNVPIGSVAQPWNRIHVNDVFAGNIFSNAVGADNNFVGNVYSNVLNAERVRSKPAQNFAIEPANDAVVSLNTNRKVVINGIGTLRLPTLSNAERDQLTPEVGDIIYNFNASSVQIYVGIVSWTQDPNPEGTPNFQPEPIPGWVNLYTPPPPP